MLQAITELPTDRRIAGVHAIPVTAAGDVVFGWNKWTGLLETIGGRVEAGETLEQALRREAIEEVGLTLEGPFVPFASYYWDSTDTYTVWFFVAAGEFVPIPTGFETSGRVVCNMATAKAIIRHLARDPGRQERLALLTLAESCMESWRVAGGERRMISRLLSAPDREQIEALCTPTAAWDLILLANLDHLAGDGELVQYWGQFEPNGQLRSVLMRYHVLWYIHADTDEQIRAWAQVIDRQGQPRIVLNGRPEWVTTVGHLLTGFQTSLRLQARLRTLDAPDQPTGDPVPGSVRQATLADVAAAARFYESAPEDVRRGADSLRRSVTGGRRMFVAEEAGLITAGALTTAELPTLAMLGGLHAVGERKRDQLSLVVQGIIGALQAEGKRICVITREPLVDEVLDQLGFAAVGPWQICHLSRM